MRRQIALFLIPLALLACDRKSSDQKAPEIAQDDKAMFEQAQKYEAESDFVRAMEVYSALADKYPQSPLRYKALFMRGYIEMENLKAPRKAIKTFDLLLKEYPDCDLADDATYMRTIAASGKDLMSTFQDSLK